MLRLVDIDKTYKASSGNVNALKKVNLSFRKNEFVSILGPSGSGKTTLLNIIGGLDKYTAGDLIIAGKSRKILKTVIGTFIVTKELDLSSKLITSFLTKMY